MQKWLDTTLGDEFKIVMGQSPASEYYNDKGKGLPFFQGKKEFGELYPNIEVWTTQATKRANEGDVLLSVRAPIGDVNIAPKECGIGRGLAAIKPDDNTCSKFILYLLKAKENELKKRGAGVTFSAITKPNLLSLPIRVPLGKHGRDKIVELVETQLTRLDAAIKSLRTIKVKLKLYRMSILKSAFAGDYTKEWRRLNSGKLIKINEIIIEIEENNKIKCGKDKPGKLPDFKKSILNNLPNGWFWVEAHKICSSVRDGTHDTPSYVEDGIPLITSKNLSPRGIDLSKIKFISRVDHEEIKKRSGVEKNDILYAMIGTIGNPTLVDMDFEFSIKNVGLFKKNERFFIPQYLKYWLESSVCLNLLKKMNLIKGTTQQFIPLGHLRILPVPYCIISEQEYILNEIESRFSVIDKLEVTVENSLQKTEKLRKSILKSAFEGKFINDL